MDKDERENLVGQLFALLTAKFEDGASIASDGQGGGASAEDLRALAARLHELGQECIVLADAVMAIVASSHQAA